MFLDGRLRALTAEKRRLAARSDLQRRTLGLEYVLAKASARRQWADLLGGVALAGRLLRLFRRR